MKVVSVDQMRALEQAALDSGLTEEELMEEAGKGIAQWLSAEFPAAREFVILCGRGKNGGDGMVAARYLSQANAVANCYSPYDLDDPVVSPIQALTFERDPSVVLVDALLGIGGRPQLSEELRGLTGSILQAGRNPVVALDVPSGVSAETGEADPDAVRATLTITCGLPKRGLFADGAVGHVGRLCVAGLPFPQAALDATETELEFFSNDAAMATLPRRGWDAHKGAMGRVHLVCGAEGTSGAAILAAEGALMSGAGLVTVWVPRSIYGIVASRVVEGMVRPFDSFDALMEALPAEGVVGAGPGLGVTPESQRAIRRLLENRERPIVLDADALNGLAADRQGYGALHDRVLLTPHPGEMARLLGGESKPRFEAMATLASQCQAAIVLKGASTLVGQAGRPMSVNSTGNPGMATGGMGDVLTGLCAGLAAQGLSVYDAGRVGVFVHGLAGDLALNDQTYQTLLPRHLLASLPDAFRLVGGR